MHRYCAHCGYLNDWTLRACAYDSTTGLVLYSARYVCPKAFRFAGQVFTLVHDAGTMGGVQGLYPSGLMPLDAWLTYLNTMGVRRQYIAVRPGRFGKKFS